MDETVLLVEDEPTIRSMCSRVLGDHGYKVLEAANGEEALRVIKSHLSVVIDLLVTDVVMPRMGGIELSRILSESHPGLKILLTSGYTADEPTISFSPDGRMLFLQKPYLPAGLLNRVREALDS